MTTAPATTIIDGYHRQVLTPGIVIDTWCAVHGRLSPHVWDPAAVHPLTCTLCHPELKPKESEK